MGARMSMTETSAPLNVAVQLEQPEVLQLKHTSALGSILIVSERMSTNKAQKNQKAELHFVNVLESPNLHSMTVPAAMDPAANDSKKETAKEEPQELVRFSLPVNVLSVKMLGNGKWEGVN